MPVTVPRSVANVRSGMPTPSSHTSTRLVAPFTERCSSRTCQPGPGATVLVVPASCASLRYPSLPVEVTYTYPPVPVGVSRRRSNVTCEP